MRTCKRTNLSTRKCYIHPLNPSLSVNLSRGRSIHGSTTCELSKDLSTVHRPIQCSKVYALIKALSIHKSIYPWRLIQYLSNHFRSNYQHLNQFIHPWIASVEYLITFIHFGHIPVYPIYPSLSNGSTNHILLVLSGLSCKPIQKSKPIKRYSHCKDF